MRTKRFFIWICMVSALAGCSSMRLYQDYDRDYDFGALETFAWLPDPQDASADVREEQIRNTLIDKRVKAAVRQGLEAKGYRLDAEDPDFYVTYHTGEEDKINVTDWGYSYAGGYRYWGWAGRDIYVYQYKEGTLVLDFVDARSRDLVWRGVVQDTLPPNPTPERMDKLVNKAVEKALAAFPPE